MPNEGSATDGLHRDGKRSATEAVVVRRSHVLRAAIASLRHPEATAVFAASSETRTWRGNNGVRPAARWESERRPLPRAGYRIPVQSPALIGRPAVTSGAAVMNPLRATARRRETRLGAA